MYFRKGARFLRACKFLGLKLLAQVSIKAILCSNLLLSMMNVVFSIIKIVTRTASNKYIGYLQLATVSD